MTTLALSAVLAVALTVRAAAQDRPYASPPPEERPRLEAPAMGIEGTIKLDRKTSLGPPPAREEEEVREPETVPASVDLERGRREFPAAVKAYVEQKSEDGVWRYKKSKSEAARKLKSPVVDAAGIRRASATRFSGPVQFTDAGSGKPVALEFTVDLGGSAPKIVAVK